jgi:hypothetical protein
MSDPNAFVLISGKTTAHMGNGSLAGGSGGCVGELDFAFLNAGFVYIAVWCKQ